MASDGKIIFANQLRGVAVVSVAYSHLVGIFWAVPALVSAVTGSEAPAGPPDTYLPFIYLKWITPGPFGVALFFLISGFVIPLSLAKQRPRDFLLARALRIYPVYCAALLIEIAVTQASAAWWRHPLPVDVWAWVSNALLINNYVGQPYTDLVNWTLAIEVKFYVLAALLAGPIRRGSLVPLFGTAGVLTAANALAAAIAAPGGEAIVSFGAETSYLIFMLVGVLFSYRLRGQLGTTRLVVSIIGMLALFLLCWYGGAAAAVNVFRENTLNYLYAVALFGALYALRRHIRPFAPLDAMAAISYPFYLVHMLVGLSILRLLMAGGRVAYGPALAIALAGVLAIATALHVTLERWTIRTGRRLANRTLTRALREPLPGAEFPR
jgi:peptidoglycan/LPS O-acetylase OafA/YrhL